MRTKIFLILPAFFLGGWAAAQTTNTTAATRPHVLNVPQPDQPGTAPATSPGSNSESDPAKIADFQKRFAEGNELAAQGKLAEARKVYDGILAEDSHARGSLFAAGQISIHLGEMEKANDYLSRLHELEPTFPAAIEMLIQVNQALKHDVKVELLIRDFRALRNSGKVPALTKSLCFVRERFAVGQQQILISQFFDYNQAPNSVWMAEVFDASGTLQRRILLDYDANASDALHAKDAKYANTQVFTWFEHELDHGQVKAIKAYLQIFALPDYAKFRSAMLIILTNPPKPLYSAPVNAAAE